MFGTWKYDPETDEVQNLRRAYDPITARSSQHQACNRCHEKKLKCSGDKDGCDRCAGSGHVCHYNRPGSRSSRRGKRAGQRDGSVSPLSNVSSPKTRHSSKSRSRASSGRAPNPVAAAPVTRAGYERTVSNEADFAVTGRQLALGPDTLAEGRYEQSSLAAHLFSPQHYADAASPSHLQDWAAGAQSMPDSAGAGFDSADLSTASQMYGAGGGFMPYDAYSGFDPYHGTDPRYWQDPQ